MIVIIPARKGSKRCPGKNILPFDDDMNLVLRTRRQAEWLLPWKIIITTDYTTKEIGLPGYNEAHDRRMNFTYHGRPEHLWGDGVTSEDVVLDVLDCRYCGEYWDDDAGDDKDGDLVESNLHDEDYFVLLQPTSPIRSVETMSKVKARFDKGDIPALVSVNPAFQPNGSFYFCRTDVFLKERTLYPPGTHFWVCSWEESVDINYPWEFRIAEAVARGDIHGR